MARSSITGPSERLLSRALGSAWVLPKNAEGNAWRERCGHVPGRYPQARIRSECEVQGWGRTHTACAPRSSQELCPGVSDVSHSGRLDRLDLLELGISHVFEQLSAAPSRIGTTETTISSSRPAARYCWATDALLPERHLLLSRGCPRLLERRLDPARDEVERRSALHLQRLARMAG